MKLLIQRILNRLPPGLHTKDRNQLLKGIFYSFIIQAIAMVLVFAGNYVAVKMVSTNEYGIYVHVFNWISILTMLALAGQDDVVLSRIPKYNEANKEREIAAVALHANKRVLITGLLVSAGFLLLIWFVPVNTLSEYKWLFLAASITIYLSAFLTLNQTILQALNYLRMSQVVERLLKPLLFLAFVLVGAFLQRIAGAQSLVIITVLNLVICAVVLGILLAGKMRVYRSAAQQPYQGSGVTRQAMYFFVISLLQLLVGKLGMLMMPWYLPEREIGIFNLAYKFADLVIYPTFLLHAVLPQLFARYHEATLLQKQALYSESTVLTLITALPLVLLNVFAGKFILGYFGEPFVAGYQALIWVSVSNLLVGIFGPANTILMMQGQEKQAAIAFAVYMCMLLGLNYWLIPLYGITGAAVAIVGGNIIYSIVVSVFVYRTTGVRSPFFRW